MSDFKLKSWQKAVVDFVEKHEDMYNEESMVTVSNYARNKACSIRASFPRLSGHTTLAAYLASKYPSILIYSDLNHYKTLKHFAKDVDAEESFDTNADCISVYHIHHDIISQSRTNAQSDALGKMKLRFNATEGTAVIVDNATIIFEAHPEILDWIYNVANGPIIILG